MATSVATIASIVSLARYLLETVDQYNRGEMTWAELEKAWADLQVRREKVKGLWIDAKKAGGYT